MKRGRSGECFANDGGFGPFGDGGDRFELRKLGLGELDGDRRHRAMVLPITAEAIPNRGEPRNRLGQGLLLR